MLGKIKKFIQERTQRHLELSNAYKVLAQQQIEAVKTPFDGKKVIKAKAKKSSKSTNKKLVKSKKKTVKKSK